MSADGTIGPVDGPAMAEWCAILRDDNAIHLRREAAEAAGFGPRRVNPGPANLAWLISRVLKDRPEAEIAELSAHFSGNVFEGDLLTATLAGDEAALARDGEPLLTARFRFREDADG